MRKFVLVAVPLALLVALALAGCGGRQVAGGGVASQNSSSVGQAPNQVQVIPGAFLPKTVTITSGKSVQFLVPQGNPGEAVCLGQDEHCASNASGPAQLRQSAGLTVRTLGSQSVTFSQPGTYQVTSLSYPGMNLTVNVTGQ